VLVSLHQAKNVLTAGIRGKVHFYCLGGEQVSRSPKKEKEHNRRKQAIANPLWRE
jgi:hypothetical protein